LDFRVSTKILSLGSFQHLRTFEELGNALVNFACSSTRYLNSSARVSACLGLRLTNDFDIDSNNFTSHGKQRQRTEISVSVSVWATLVALFHSFKRSSIPTMGERERVRKSNCFNVT